MYEQQYRDPDSANGDWFVMGLLCGAAIGAAVGLMFAPKSGTELRRQLSASTEEWRRQAADSYDQASKVVADFASRGRAVFKRTTESSAGTGTMETGSFRST